MTNTRWRWLGGVAIAVVPSLLGAQAFEGAITMRIAANTRNGPATQELEYLSRGGNVRVGLTTPMGSMAVLGLAAEQKTYIVMDAQRSYVEMVAPGAAMNRAATAKVSRTGRSETIAGYVCEHVIIESVGANGPNKDDMCLTTALGPYINPMSAMSGPMSAWQRQLISDGAFPLKVTLADGSVALEVTKVEKRRVSDTLFRIPADFNKMEMPRRPPPPSGAAVWRDETSSHTVR